LDFEKSLKKKNPLTQDVNSNIPNLIRFNYLTPRKSNCQLYPSGA
jgi:hypothetical protein